MAGYKTNKIIFSRDDCLKETKKNYHVCKAFKKIPEYSKTRFYISPNKNKIITANKIDLGRNICVAKVGDFGAKERNCSVEKIRYIYYPDFKELSLFDGLSYHGAESQGKNKVTHYGTKDYNLQYTKLTPKMSVKLSSPVKTENKNNFYKEINEVELTQKDYVVLNWIPEGGKTFLQVKQSKTSPLGDEETIFESPRFDLSKKDEVIKLFYDKVDSLK